jgi:hypothetical protein
MDIKISSSIAIYGAIVGSISLFMHIYVALRDRARIIIQVYQNRKILGGGTAYDQSKTYIQIFVANRGRRPVTVEKVLFEYFKDKSSTPFSLLADSLRQGPKEITEGKSESYCVDQAGHDWATVRAIHIVDNTGRTYKKRLCKRERKNYSKNISN